MMKLTYSCDCCGEVMNLPKTAAERYKMSITSPTKEWNLSEAITGLLICKVCALTIDNELLKMKLNAIK